MKKALLWLVAIWIGNLVISSFITDHHPPGPLCFPTDAVYATRLGVSGLALGWGLLGLFIGWRSNR